MRPPHVIAREHVVSCVVDSTWKASRFIKLSFFLFFQFLFHCLYYLRWKYFQWLLKVEYFLLTKNRFLNRLPVYLIGNLVISLRCIGHIEGISAQLPSYTNHNETFSSKKKDVIEKRILFFKRRVLLQLLARLLIFMLGLFTNVY